MHTLFTSWITKFVFTIKLLLSLSREKMIRAFSKNVVGVMENSSFKIDCNVLPHHDDWSKDDLWVWHNRGFNSVLLTIDRDKRFIDSERILRAITSRIAPGIENQVKFKDTDVQQLQIITQLRRIL